MSEFRKYNPANMVPELLLRPPTQVVESEARYLSRQVAGDICGKRDRLRMGTELEIFFFSPDADPLAAYQRARWENPNYQPVHEDKMDKLKRWAEGRRGRPEGPHSMQSKLCIEFRTRPADVKNYFSRLDVLRDAIETQCRQFDVLPVVHSQHIHVSFLNSDGVNPVERAGEYHIHDDMKEKFSPVLPLVLLPEEIGQHWRHNPVYFNGTLGARRDPYRIEFRMLSSEWACDSSLNTLLSLRAFRSVLDRGKNCEDSQFKVFDGNYGASVAAMRDNGGLKEFFGEAALGAICDVVQHYPQVSTREITVKDIASGDVPPGRENFALDVTVPSFMDRIRAIGSFFWGNRSSSSSS